MVSAERDTPHTLLLRLSQERRDDQAWTEFVQRYQPRITSWCRKRGLQPADADDVTQIVLEKLLDEMRQFRYDPSKSFRAWLRTVTLRACTKFQLAETRLAGRKDDDALKEMAKAPAREDLANRIVEAFDEELLQLATELVQERIEHQTWEAFRLTELEGMTGAEASKQLGISVAYVFVARKRVRDMLTLEVARLKRAAEGPSAD